MNRADPSAPFNIKPFRTWLAEGRVVRRGQKGYRGLFHRDPTDAIPASPPPKGKRPFLKAVKPQPQPAA